MTVPTNIVEARRQVDAAVAAAERALEQAEALAGIAAQNLVGARVRLRAHPAPANAAQALDTVGLAAAHCPVEAVDAVRAAERAVRDVVVLRCCSTTSPRDRDLFLAGAEEAFGRTLELQLHSQLLLAYKKVIVQRAAVDAVSAFRAAAETELECRHR